MARACCPNPWTDKRSCQLLLSLPNQALPSILSPPCLHLDVFGGLKLGISACSISFARCSPSKLHPLMKFLLLNQLYLLVESIGSCILRSFGSRDFFGPPSHQYYCAAVPWNIDYSWLPPTILKITRSKVLRTTQRFILAKRTKSRNRRGRVTLRSGMTRLWKCQVRRDYKSSVYD